MRPTRDKSKCASYSKSTSQSNRSNASVKERGEHASHGSVDKSSKRAGAESHERGGHSGGGEHTTHSPIDIRRALKGAPYPVKKQALVRIAQADGAVDNALRTLRNMPDDEYDTPTIVSKAASSGK